MSENFEAHALAAYGAAEGVYKYFVRDRLTAARGWLAIAGLVTAYELAAPQGELLSEGVDRALNSHPLLTKAAIGVTALHLVNMIPERLDPFKRGLDLIRGFNGQR